MRPWGWGLWCEGVGARACGFGLGCEALGARLRGFGLGGGPLGCGHSVVASAVMYCRSELALSDSVQSAARTSRATAVFVLYTIM